MALPDGVTIRRGVPAEAEALAQLHLDVWDDAYPGLMPQEILDERRSTSGSSGGAGSSVRMSRLGSPRTRRAWLDS
jgi:hypothetical protein